jgi:hypothetical protein
MKTYVTFGLDHHHDFNGKVFDSNCVAVIECDSASHGRKMAFGYFGKEFCFEYPEEYFPMDTMKYYPRGFITVTR